jgi:predicted dehydrogenase
MGRLTGVIIGCGAIAREHLAALAELKDIDVTAVCDLSAARAEATAERFQIKKWYSDSEQMLSDIRPDLVHITTPPSAHFPLAQRCLASGLNVLCEKPITLDYQQFSQLKQLATEKQRLLMENQNFRYHSSVKRIQDFITSGEFGDVIDVQICVSLNVGGAGSPYVDRNVPHFGMALRGGVIGDFLTHISYLAYMFTGPISELRTTWRKRVSDSPLPADEFRGFLKGERASAYVSFSGNAQPNGFWLRVSGTKMHAEANLFEPPRLTIRRLRGGEPALMTLIDGLAESRDVLRGAFGGLSRKLAGGTPYDGLPEMIARTYKSLEMHTPPPVPLDEIDEISRLVDRFTSPDIEL